MPHRILFTIPNFITAGSGREMVNIIERLDRSLFEPWVAVSVVGGNIYDELINKGIPVLQLDIYRADEGLLRNILHGLRLGRKLRKYNFKIWQSFNWSSDYTEAITARFSGAKYVFVKKNMNWGRKAWRVKSRLANRIIARNKTMLSTFYRSAKFSKKVRLIQGGVDETKFVNDRNEEYRTKYQIVGTDFLIGCVAQVVRIKGQHVLIKAISQLENVSVILAGSTRDKEYFRELVHLVNDLGLNNRVHFANNISDVNKFLNNCDAFVLPTTIEHGHEEGCPVAMLEAMASEVPIIASNVAGSNDLVIHEETGLLFEPGNADDLTDCIKRYINGESLGQAFAYNALQVIKQQHTLNIEAKAFEAVYKELIV